MSDESSNPVKTPAHSTEAEATEPVEATEAAEAAPAGTVQTVFVHAPVPPRKKGNRGIGSLIAVLSTVIFVVVYALVIAIIDASRGQALGFAFLGDVTFYTPALFFLVGFVVLVLIVNRAAWWAYILGSLLVAVFVYFGTAGVGMLVGGAIVMTPAGAAALFGKLLINPYLIAAAFVAREVAIWMGSAISARGRRLRLHNVETRRAYEADLAEKRAEYEKAAAAAHA